MVNAALLEAMERLTADEQEAVRAFAEYQKHHGGVGTEQALLAEVDVVSPAFALRMRSFHQRGVLRVGLCQRIPG
jgi:hypothetical protein